MENNMKMYGNIEPAVKKKPSLKDEIISWAMTFAVMLVSVFLINTFIFRTVEVQGSSMYPTLVHEDRVIVWKLNYSPQFQDIIVLEHTDGILHVKRIIGTPGDHVDYIGGDLFINEVLVTEPYIAEETSFGGFLFDNLCRITHRNTNCEVIPEGYFLVLGDNRNNSGDSREYGLIHESQIMGRATLRFLPFTQFGMVE